MALRPVALPPGIAGSLLLGAMPGRFESWGDFEGQAQRAGLQLVVCLTPRAELAELSPRYHAAVTEGSVPFRWMNVPVPNFGVPGDEAGFRRDVQAIAQALKRGDAVMLHCAAGIGRTGSTAACVLKALGASTGDALARVRDAGSNPQNALQAGVVDWF
ncbi:MAG: tyrosine-protein phosphatase [Ramlibacter sp.]|nr:tyrosine-protein phosphatase [Ramlibacter sp.]